MLWSLIKIVIFVAAVAALALGAIYLLESEGGIQVSAMGYEVTLGPLESVLSLAALVFAVWLLLKLLSLLVACWRFLNGDETALSRYFDRNRERKGFQALSEGLMALASGERRVAMTKAAKAAQAAAKDAAKKIEPAKPTNNNTDKSNKTSALNAKNNKVQDKNDRNREGG